MTSPIAYRSTIEAFRRSNKTGAFLFPTHGETCWRTLDGSDVAAWLTKIGYTVIKNRDTGRNGEATTACGLCVSTNGYFCRVK